MNLITRAKDASKDQTYFIWQIRPEQLPHILFPVGEFGIKSDVRTYAKSKGLITSSKPDSQGLCFVGQTSLRDMLLQTLGRKDGFIYTYLTQEQVDKVGIKVTKKTCGKISLAGKFKIRLGQHQGAFLYTIGQRQALGISNGPWFVAELDIINNEIIVCHNEFQQSIESTIILVKDLNWHLDITQNLTYTKSIEIKPNEKLKNILNNIFNFSSDTKNSELIKIRPILQKNKLFSSLPNRIFDYIQNDHFFEKYRVFKLKLKAQIRYRSQAKDCDVFVFVPLVGQSEGGNLGFAVTGEIAVSDDSFAVVQFDEPIKAATKGQSIVFYDVETDQYLIGGGVIEKVLRQN